MSITLPSFAKINLYLRVLGRRADEFHELCTVFQTVSLSDTLRFEESGEFRLSCSLPSVETNERNLIFRAAANLADRYRIPLKGLIHLTKEIPSPGGLGGGSSNAAVALIGLRRLWDLDISDRELCEIGAGIGSDVPFFLTGGTAIGSGRGELIEPIANINEDAILIVTPDVAVSTREAFQALALPPLTKPDDVSNLSVCREAVKSLDLRHSVLINDFEESVFDAHPEIRRVKETLLELGAVNAAMSGSGASVFAIFDNIETRQTAMKALDHESTWRKFAVATVSRSEYREALHL